MKGLTFSEPMVRAWLEGRKDVTRRLMNPQPGFWVGGVPYRGNIEESNHDIEIKSPYRPGETVYIKEAWADLRGMGFGNDPRTDKPFLVAYKADTRPGSDGDRARKDYGVKWKSPRFMPEWAARSHALIVSVRPEKIQEITIGEVRKEGFFCEPMPDDTDLIMGRHPFVVLWESLHPGSWERNDWVWRIEPKKQEGI